MFALMGRKGKAQQVEKRRLIFRESNFFDLGLLPVE